MFLKIIIFSCVIITLSITGVYIFGNGNNINSSIINKNTQFSDKTGKNNSQNSIKIKEIASKEAKQFYLSAKSQIGVVKEYDFSNGYYSSGGFPPVGVGVCSDVIRMAFKGVGIDFKKLITEDISKNPDYYGNDFDSNINFRRVKNLDKYFSKNSNKKLTNEIMPFDEKNLENWQVGDIVIFDKIPPKGLRHVAIISDLRREDGVPYMIDNHGYGVDIHITPLDWPGKIIGHYRVF